MLIVMFQISDDILIHDQILERVLLQIDSIGTTLNLKKHLFSTEGLLWLLVF